MAQKEITVVINGKEYVSQAAEEAGASLTIFGKKIPLVVDATRLLELGMNALRSAFAFVKNYTMEAIASYDAFAASQTKMAAQSKLTGVSLDQLNAIARTAKDQFALSSVVANEAATTVAKYASRAGDATKANELLAAALDLGAASGLDAAATMEALEQGLRGQDEGFDRLLGRNPSALWKEYADANGLAVGKMDDTQKRMAELTAIMDAGAKVQGSYNDRVTSGAGEQDKLNNALDDAKVRFGQAVQPARILVTQGLVVLVDWLGRVMLAIGRVANALTVAFVGAFKLAESVVGGFAVALGKLTGNKALEQWGTRQAASLGDYIAQVKKLEDRYLTTGNAAETSAAQQVTATKTVQTATETAAQKAERDAKRVEAALNQSLGEPLRRVIGITEGAIRSLADAADQQLPPDVAAKFNAHMQALAENAKKVGERITAVPEPVAQSAKHAEKMAREVEQIGRSAIDAAASFGVIDDTAARSLNSAVNIAASLGKMMASGFTFGGVVGTISGVASIVSVMMQGDKERRELTRANTEALNKLRTEGVSLSTKASGGQISGIQGALAGIAPGDLQKLAGMDSNDASRTVGNRLLVDLLAKQGLRLSDLDAVANELGFKIRRDNGQIALSQLPLLFQALQENAGQLTRIGQTFGAQLANFKDEQRVRGATGVGGLQGMLDFLRNVGGARAFNGLDLSDPTKARNQLLDMLTGLNNNVFSAADFGRLTGEEFRTALLDLIGLLDNLKDQAPVNAAPPTTTTDDVVTTTAGVTMSVQSVQEVIEAMHTGVEGVLKEHTGYHQRIAEATEGSFGELQLLNAKMDDLIAATAGSIARIDRELGEARLIAVANAGRGPEFG